MTSNHQDIARIVAFDTHAPQDERVDALSQLHQSHTPKSDSGLILPRGDLQQVIQDIANEWQHGQLEKAMNPHIIPFPSKNLRDGERGMQSVSLDNLQINAHGDYWEKPSAFGFDSMRAMVAQTPVLNAVIMTRVRQIQAFCRVNESGHGAGFTIRHIDKDHQISQPEKESIALLHRFVQNCGWEFNPRQRKRLKRDSFPQFIAKLARDSLSMDSAPIETEMKLDKKQGIDGLYAVDGATIRLCSENGYQGDDELFAVQVVQGRISAAYTHDDLIYEARNPQSDVLCSGYGIGETELLIRVVTGFLNAMTLNIKGFSDNAIPKGMLHLTGDYSTTDLAAFRRYWNNMVKGVNNAWTLPLMVSKDAASKASFERFGVDFNEMMFGKWMTFLTSIICAIYGMSPAEINFDSFSGGSTSPLSGGDTAEKLAASKDSGLRPLLSYFEGIMSDYVIGEFGDKYVFRWTGLEEDDSAKREERSRMVLTVNEMRAQEGLDKLDGALGDCPLNPTLTGIWMKLQGGEPQEAGENLQKSSIDSNGLHHDELGRFTNNPVQFIPTASGSLDFGEITPDMARAMRRQAGKIRLQQGTQNADGSGFGLAHIEARHGAQIRKLGYADIASFVLDALKNFNEIWKPEKTSQVVAIVSNAHGRAIYLQLSQAKDSAGDFYRVNSAFPVSREFARKKAEKEGWKALWSRYPVPADASGASSFVDRSPNAGETIPMVSSQSDDGSLPEPLQKSIDSLKLPTIYRFELPE